MPAFWKRRPTSTGNCSIVGPAVELWFLTGLNDGRIGALLKLHHTIADGQAAVRIMGSLTDLTAEAPDPAPAPWTPRVGARRLATAGGQHLHQSTAGRPSGGGAGPSDTSRPGDRRLLAGGAQDHGDEGRRPTSLNRPVEAGRRVAFLRLDLAAAKEAAHAQGGKVNDVVLALWAGGLRGLLASRGEPVAGVELTTSVMLSTRAAADAGIDNQVGTVVLPLPVGKPTCDIVSTGSSPPPRAAKNRQQSAAIMGVLLGLAATPVGATSWSASGPPTC